MSLNRRNLNNKSKLSSNKTLTIVFSIALFFSLIVIAYFLINQNKDNNIEKPNTTSSDLLKDVESSSQSNSESSSSSDLSDENDQIKLTANYNSWNEKCSPELIVINSNNKISENYVVNLSDYCGVPINSIISNPLNRMIMEARNQKGLNLWLSSSYRDLATQTHLFENQVKEKLSQGYPQQKAEGLAAKEVARPGYSEHNTGLAVDFNGVKNNFKETEEYKWLLENSYKYGFILRYPEEKKNLTGIIYEPWHFRFVGVDVATKIKSQNICLEEYILSVK